MTQENNKDKFLRLFGKGKDQNKEPIEKPIVIYYAKYIGLGGTNKSLPIDEGVYVRIYDDRIDIDFLKSKGPRTIIHFDEMIDMQNVDAGNKVDVERVIGLGVLTAGIGSIVGLLWKRHHIVTVIKYNDANGEQTIALDFLADTKYAQPLIYKKMRDIQQQRKIESLENAVNQPSSLADELSKIAKLKEQGVITEEEFLQMKNNLMKRMID